MNFSLSFYIGYRYWRSRKTNAFASFITLFSVSGILLGVSALIMVSSVMNGLEGQLKQRILGAIPQLTVHATSPIINWQSQVKRIESIEGIQSATPSISTQAMVQSSANISAAQVYGIYPQFETQILAPVASAYLGSFKTLTSGSYHIILGAQLARKLQVQVGDKIRVLSGDGVVYTPLGPVPSQRKFTVSGLFEMGSTVDGSLAYINHDDAQRLMRQKAGEIKQLRLYLDDPYRASQLSQPVMDLFKSQGQAVTTTDWRKTYGHLFSAVQMEKNMMSLMLSLIIAVAAFNIISALVMMVVDKTTDVAVLKTQGLSTANIMGVFMIQGSLNAIIGLVSGLLVGILLTLNINTITQGLGISILGPGQNLPVQLHLAQLGWIVCGTLFITLVATLYPALRAARVQPANALRYE